MCQNYKTKVVQFLEHHKLINAENEIRRKLLTCILRKKLKYESFYLLKSFIDRDLFS